MACVSKSTQLKLCLTACHHHHQEKLNTTLCMELSYKQARTTGPGMALQQNSESDNMVHHTHKCSDEYKVGINVNLTHLESLTVHATDFILSFKKEYLRKVTTQTFQKASLPT